MKKVLSVILSLAIVVSSVSLTCFAQEKTNEIYVSKEMENASTENPLITELKELLHNNDCKGQEKLCQCLLNDASFYEDQRSNIGGTETKVVRYNLFSLIFNLLKLVTMDSIEMCINLCFYTLALFYIPSKALVKLGVQAVVYIAKVMGRTPQAVLYMLKGKLSDSELQKQCKGLFEDMIAEMN